jgi:hypothetical protein
LWQATSAAREKIAGDEAFISLEDDNAAPAAKSVSVAFILKAKRFTQGHSLRRPPRDGGWRAVAQQEG